MKILKTLLICSLLFPLISCQKDDVSEPSIQKEWYEGNYSGVMTGNDILVDVEKNTFTLTTYVDGQPDAFIGSDSLVFNSSDSVVFQNNFPGKVIITNTYIMKMRTIENVQIFSDIQLTRID